MVVSDQAKCVERIAVHCADGTHRLIDVHVNHSRKDMADIGFVFTGI
jgi:hypothetical protein